MSVDAVRTPAPRRMKMFSKADFITGRYAAKLHAIRQQYSLAQIPVDVYPLLYCCTNDGVQKNNRLSIRYAGV